VKSHLPFFLFKHAFVELDGDWTACVDVLDGKSKFVGIHHEFNGCTCCPAEGATPTAELIVLTFGLIGRESVAGQSDHVVLVGGGFVCKADYGEAALVVDGLHGHGVYASLDNILGQDLQSPADTVPFSGAVFLPIFDSNLFLPLKL